MSKLVKEIAGLCYSLDKLYYMEENPERKREVEKNFRILSRLLGKAIKHQFNENDLLYKKDIRRLRKVAADIKRREKGLCKYETLITKIIQIADRLDYILSKDS